MFVILLRFADNKPQAGQFMDAHNAWIDQGFEDNVFLMVGSLQPNQGGAILAQSSSLAELEARVSQDPFVEQKIVTAEVLEISPARTTDQLTFLKSN